MKQLRSELEAAQAAAGAAAELTAEWRQRADQFDRDRQAAAANIRLAVYVMIWRCLHCAVPLCAANLLYYTHSCIHAFCAGLPAWLTCPPCKEALHANHSCCTSLCLLFRKAEKELELVAADNERMFRQVGGRRREGSGRSAPNEAARRREGAGWWAARRWLAAACSAVGSSVPLRNPAGAGAPRLSTTFTADNVDVPPIPTPTPPTPIHPLNHRQLNFVRTRLMGQLTNLDGSVPDIGKLARELQSWCDRETAQRARHKA